MGENKTSLAGVWTAIILLAFMLIGGIAYMKYIHSDTTENVVVEQTKNSPEYTIPTVEEKLVEHAEIVRETKYYDTYLALPDIILEAIYHQKGTNITPTEVAEEYLRNREFYLSVQLSKEIDKIKLTGPDAGEISQVELKTILRKKEAPGETIHSVPTDSLK